MREQQARWRDARAEYEAALAFEPDNTFMRERLAAVQIELGDPASAVAELERILAGDPKQPRVRALLVRARLALRAQRRDGSLD